eukprot:CAMPEP_0169320298 /NCGR_PEP_ID=MMETSP1017-20121227/8284_1 /TAXON_ID=342587 /ORGANISM="Karlodinium micrum, Strain CCMP2283" /LENGTH=152 /DNA_ID=CAMNT_0009414709 /DNA_START=190 /DNA_END=649 /DNA_ORIENTATION=+
MEPGFSDAADNPDDDEMRRDVPTTDDDVEGAAAETSRYQEEEHHQSSAQAKFAAKESLSVKAEAQPRVVEEPAQNSLETLSSGYFETAKTSSDLGRGERREPELGERWGPNRSCEAGNDRCGEHFGELIRDLSFRSVTAGGTRTWMSAFTFR